MKKEVNKNVLPLNMPYVNFITERFIKHIKGAC